MHVVNIAIIHCFCSIFVANGCQTAPTCSCVLLGTKVGTKLHYGDPLFLHAAIFLHASNAGMHSPRKYRAVGSIASVSVEINKYIHVWEDV